MARVFAGDLTITSAEPLPAPFAVLLARVVREREAEVERAARPRRVVGSEVKTLVLWLRGLHRRLSG